ncbi:DUF6328 family protein [Streptomyces sp. AK02-01A]|uniref:DUF6328 family protein n=1 Tax=Streptomyces sp. AK02-01A TaxID=3028648 RepID=UPI0029A26716|nr:DUF6328 family protein [Streptomyces sp. AK02-01A]MDX3853125.1 DUF6328 family protein [Streptomyces sp. AK02-01A]
MAQDDSGRGRGHGRDETIEQRADRLWGELLQELRIAQTGVQILFGFLLTVVFQARFSELSDADRTLYAVTVMLGASAVGALIGPVSLHRLLTGHRLKPQVVAWASRLALAGLVLLLCTMASALLLVLRLALDNTIAASLVGVMVLWFLLCWFALPAFARHAVRKDSGGADSVDAGPARRR